MLSSIYSVISNLIDVGLKPNTFLPFASALKGGVIDCVSCFIQPLIRITMLYPFQADISLRSKGHINQLTAKRTILKPFFLT